MANDTVKYSTKISHNLVTEPSLTILHCYQLLNIFPTSRPKESSKTNKSKPNMSILDAKQLEVRVRETYEPWQLGTGTHRKKSSNAVKTGRQKRKGKQVRTRSKKERSSLHHCPLREPSGGDLREMGEKVKAAVSLRSDFGAEGRGPRRQQPQATVSVGLLTDNSSPTMRGRGLIIIKLWVESW